MYSLISASRIGFLPFCAAPTRPGTSDADMKEIEGETYMETLVRRAKEDGAAAYRAATWDWMERRKIDLGLMVSQVG